MRLAVVVTGNLRCSLSATSSSPLRVCAMSYKTQRGVVTEHRPYADLDADEREQILEDSLTMPTSELLKKWNISRQTLGHLRFHYKEALEEIEEQHFKERGL